MSKLNRRNFIKSLTGGLVCAGVLPVVGSGDNNPIPLARFKPGFCERCIQDATFDSHSAKCQVCCMLTDSMVKHMEEENERWEDQIINGTGETTALEASERLKQDAWDNVMAFKL